MRKRTISFLSDKLLWFILLTLPILFALVFTAASSKNYTFSQDMTIEVQSLSVSGDLIYCLDGSNNFDGALYLAIPQDAYDEEYSFIFRYGPGVPSNDNNMIDVITLYNYLGPPMYGSMLSDGSTYALFTRTNDFIVYNDVTYYKYVPINGVGGILSDFTELIEDIGYDTSLGYGIDFNLSNSYVLGIEEEVITNSDTYFYSYFKSLNYCLDNWFTFGDGDLVYNAFNSIFGSESSILPIFVEGSFIPKYLTYMGWIYVLHVVFDLLVFIPRLAHKWLGKVYNDEDS